MAKPEELETEDFLGVDVLAVGGPYFGTGSPEEGDFYTEGDLQTIADNTRKLMEAGELHAPIKLGHSFDQKLAKESGYSDGEMPALGWLDNPHVSENKLKVDLMKVPKKLGGLLKSGAFRTRSVELRSYVSQKGGGKVGPAIRGLALQGAKSPAVRTLDDIIALYSDEVDEADVQTREYGEVIWNPDLGYRWVQNAISTALNPTDATIRYYVADVGPESALVTATSAVGGSWVIPFAITDDTATVAPAAQWIQAQDRWVTRAREYADESGEQLLLTPADTSGKMLNFTEEQVQEFAERLGLEGDEIEFEAVSEKLDELKALAEKDPEADEADPDPDAPEMVKVPKDEWETTKTAAAAGASAERQLAEMARDKLLEDAVSEGKLVPADLPDWKRRYDEHPEVIREVVTSLRPHEQFIREYGTDSTGTEDDADRELGDAFDSYMGIAEEDRVIGGKA